MLLTECPTLMSQNWTVLSHPPVKRTFVGTRQDPFGIRIECPFGIKIECQVGIRIEHAVERGRRKRKRKGQRQRD